MEHTLWRGCQQEHCRCLIVYHFDGQVKPWILPWPWPWSHLLWKSTLWAHVLPVWSTANIRSSVCRKLRADRQYTTTEDDNDDDRQTDRRRTTNATPKHKLMWPLTIVCKHTYQLIAYNTLSTFWNCWHAILYVRVNEHGFLNIKNLRHTRVWS